MSLRDRIKQRVKSKVATARDAGAAAAAAQRGASAARERARQARTRLEAVDAGEVPDQQDDARSQAERAEQTAKMTAPIPGARLDPIDVPHPYEGARQRGDPGMEEFVTGRGGARRDEAADDRPTMEDLVTGGRPREDDADRDAADGLLDFGEMDDETEEWF